MLPLMLWFAYFYVVSLLLFRLPMAMLCIPFGRTSHKNWWFFLRMNSRLKFILIWKCKWFIFVTWVEVQKKSRFWGHKCTVHNNVTFLTSLNYKNCCNFSTVIILSSLIYDGVNQVNQNVLEAYLQITLQGRRRL